MTKFSRSANGKYVVHGKSFDMLIGTRAQIWHGTAYKTSGGLTKSHLMKNHAGRIVSKAKHISAKKEMRLVKAGYGTKKGKFGFVKLGKKGSKTKRGGRGPQHHVTHNVSHNVRHNMSHNSGNHSRGQRGGSGLNPAPYNGKGVQTSGAGIQLVATQH